MKLLARVVSKLDQMGVPCALIGGVALAFHGIDRATEDLDLLATEPSILESPLWEDLRSEGIDIVVPRGRWQEDILARRLERVILGERIPVVDAADLILLKVHAGGLIDLVDVELLIRHDPSLRAIVEARLEKLPRRMKAAWKELLPRLGPAPRAPE